MTIAATPSAFVAKQSASSPVIVATQRSAGGASAASEQSAAANSLGARESSKGRVTQNRRPSDAFRFAPQRPAPKAPFSNLIFEPTDTPVGSEL